MLFAEWMDAKGIRPADIVDRVREGGQNTTVDMVYKVRRGERRFSPEIILIIVSWSGGEVSWEEMSFPEKTRAAASE